MTRYKISPTPETPKYRFSVRFKNGNPSDIGPIEKYSEENYLVNLKFLNLFFKGTSHFECDSNNFLSLLLNPWTNGVGLLSELESEINN